MKTRLAKQKMNEAELIREYEKRWINEGFLSREHEEMRKKAGEKALRLFYHQEERASILPSLLEKNFKWQSGKVKFIGRWDRVDFLDEGAVIIDYKATEVKDQKEADKKTKSSLQMDIYALSFVKTQNTPLIETQLYFLESGTVGHAPKGGEEMDKALQKIKEAEAGIKSQDYEAKPDWHNCSVCDFRAICAYSYSY